MILYLYNKNIEEGLLHYLFGFCIYKLVHFILIFAHFYYICFSYISYIICEMLYYKKILCVRIEGDIILVLDYVFIYVYVDLYMFDVVD